MDLVQDNPFAVQAREELLGVVHLTPHAGQLAIEVFDRIQRLGEASLTDATHSCQPDNGSLDHACSRRCFHSDLVTMALSYLRRVAPNASLIAFGNARRSV